MPKNKQESHGIEPGLLDYYTVVLNDVASVIAVGFCFIIVLVLVVVPVLVLVLFFALALVLLLLISLFFFLMLSLFLLLLLPTDLDVESLDVKRPTLATYVLFINFNLKQNFF